MDIFGEHFSGGPGSGLCKFEFHLKMQFLIEML